MTVGRSKKRVIFLSGSLVNNVCYFLLLPQICKNSCQSLSFSFRHNVLVNLGLHLLRVLTTKINPQTIFSGFIYSLKKQSMQGLEITSFTSVKIRVKETEDMHLKRLSA